MGILFYAATHNVRNDKIYVDCLDRESEPSAHEVEVSVGCGNAALVLEALGSPGVCNFAACDCYGDLPADDFLGRVLIAELVAPYDDGTDTYLVRSGDAVSQVVAVLAAGGAQVWNCGRNAGYLQERLARLRTLAHWCRDRGYRVAWA